MLDGLNKDYFMHDRTLPGNPDFVYPKMKKAIFVHGCFWHRHSACNNGGRIPKSKKSYWIKKLARNHQRDQQNFRKLNRLGWKYRVIWECDLRKSGTLSKLVRFLNKKS